MSQKSLNTQEIAISYQLGSGCWKILMMQPLLTLIRVHVNRQQHAIAN